MNTRLGTNLYRAGLVGATLSILYTINIVLTVESGRSFIPLPERYISHEEMLASVAVGVALALLFWIGGAVAKYLVNKSAEAQAIVEKSRSAGAPAHASQPENKSQSQHH